MEHLIIGAGEVGSALLMVLAEDYEVMIRDLKPVSTQARVLHVTFPWSDQFVEQVLGYQGFHGAELVIVHSTVPIRTCDPYGWVHSPVRGQHPKLVESIKLFTKHFGGAQSKQAADIFVRLGVQVRIHPRAVETEAGKLFELVQFGRQVLTEKAIYDWCEREGIDYQVVYRQFAQTYNRGYQMLDIDKYVRPVLDHMPGPIGGHCVKECSAFLDHPLAQEVANSDTDRE